MPYVREDIRHDLDRRLSRANTTGELTYVMYRAAVDYLRDHVGDYQTRAEIIAAFECGKLEFARQHLAPYEDEKIRLNGDVR
jgi:hypothetical protein